MPLYWLHLLSDELTELRNDLSLLERHHDELNRNLAQTSRELDELHSNSLAIDSRISEKDQKICEMNDELRQLDDASTDCSANTVDIADELEKLAKLRQDEILTEDEFNMQKNRLLN